MAQDHKQAFAWYERAAMRGLAPAQFRLGGLLRARRRRRRRRRAGQGVVSPGSRAGPRQGHAQSGRADRRQRQATMPTMPPPRAGSSRPPSAGSPTASSISPCSTRMAAASPRTWPKPTSGSRWPRAAATRWRRADWSRSRRSWNRPSWRRPSRKLAAWRREAGSRPARQTPPAAIGSRAMARAGSARQRTDAGLAHSAPFFAANLPAGLQFSGTWCPYRRGKARGRREAARARAGHCGLA